jgi:hypothetical protein
LTKTPCIYSRFTPSTRATSTTISSPRASSTAARREPAEEFDGRAGIGAARVRIPDLRREEFKEAIAGAVPEAATTAGARSANRTSWLM